MSEQQFDPKVYDRIKEGKDPGVTVSVRITQQPVTDTGIVLALCFHTQTEADNDAPVTTRIAATAIENAISQAIKQFEYAMTHGADEVSR